MKEKSKTSWKYLLVWWIAWTIILFFAVSLFSVFLVFLCFFGFSCELPTFSILIFIVVSAIQVLVIKISKRLLLSGISTDTLLVISVLVAMVHPILYALIDDAQLYLVFYWPVTGALVVASEFWLQKRYSVQG